MAPETAIDIERRLAAVSELHVLDRIGDPVLTSLTRLASAITGSPMAAIHIFDADYQRRIAATGVPLGEDPASESMCRIVVLSGTRVVTRDATLDGRFDYSPFVNTTEVAPVRFYASVPLRVGGGVAIGTLCAFDTVPRELSEDQISRLEDIAEIARAHLELVKIASDLGHAATLDPLTGAVNRVIFDDRLAQALALRRRHDLTLLVAVIDLDSFKQLNDTYGHRPGDDALQWVARGLRRLMRREADTIGRLGGDEFGLLAEITDAITFDSLMDEIRHTPDGFDPPFSLSVGGVIATPEDTVESVVRRADEAMYADKGSKPR